MKHLHCPHREILLVDQEPLPQGFIESLHRASFPVRDLRDEDEALRHLRDRGANVAVIAADHRLLRRMATALPHSEPARDAQLIRLLITDASEPQADFAAINEVRVFRILEKPWQADVASRYLHEALALHTQQCQASEGGTGLRDALAFLAHEVNGPLSVIQGYARAQARSLGAFSTAPTPTGPLKQALEATERSARHCQSLMTWAAETSQSASMPREPVASFASGALGWVLQSYPFASREKDWVTVDIEHDVPLPAKAALLQLVLFTLIRQALDALHRVAKPRLKISLCIQEGMHCIRFSHNGQRPPDEVREALTAGRFQGWGGLGTGLVFCQRVMRSLQGDFQIVLDADEETAALLCFGPVEEPPTDTRKRDLALRLSP